MIRLSEIVNAFSTLVGWEGVKALERADSGLYFQEAHPLLTLRAMKAIMPENYSERYPEYEEETSYAKGAKVRFGGKVYESKVDNNLLPPSSENWAEFEPIADYLNGLTLSGIKKAVNKIVGEKIASMESKNIVDRRTLFDGAGRKEARTRNDGRLVGFEITPLRSNGITAVLNKIGLQFVGNTGSVKIYLFHSSQSEPIATKEIEYTSANGSFMWFDLEDWVLPYSSAKTNDGGSWYVVYDQSQLSPYMESVNFGRDWTREPCGTCNKGDVNLYRLTNRYATFMPFYVSTSGWDGKLWDIEDMVYCGGNNFGMNFNYSLVCDITDTIILEKSLFAHAIQLQVATDALRTLALNPEVKVNRVQYNADRDNIMFEVAGNGQGIKGLQGELDKAYKAIDIDLKGLDPVCMGCRNKGVRFTSI